MSTTPNRATNTPGKSRPKDVPVDLPTARQMLPLVRHIVTDIVGTHRRLAELAPEREALEDARRNLDWSRRQRRYTIGDEIASAERHMNGVVTELTALGVKLVDPAAGRVDFPTRINGRQAAFSWQLGEDAVGFWRYAGEDQRRTIPSDWQAGTALRGRAEP